MNRTKLKNYAPQARRDFIQAMKDRAAYYGLTAKKTEPVVEKGDVAVIGGRSFPIAVAKKRKALEDRIKKHGFEQTMEAMAYTWFNRLVAIRFMELHEYLDHGYRVLSHPEGKPTPEILEHAEHIELPGLKRDAVIDLKLAGNKESELYRLLLTAQCNALNKAMPFLFEKIDDETELLLPDNLLHSDSLIRKLVNEIDEEDWQEVEIIGWLYQFYISEKKDEVIGKVVASEDIPAATQLFTPNWIVKYLVQNTLGRQWLATYPQSALRQQMDYYIEPAEQTPEVQEQLKAITPTSLNPEELTLLDPACGSGHILVEAYDLFKAIYQERGYRAKDIPALILQKNLFGLEIDDRAAQLAAFALMMKARADDRRIFDSEAKPHVVALQDSTGLKASEIFYALMSPLKGEQPGEPEPDAPDGHLFEPDDNLFTRAEAAKATANRPLPTANFSQADIASLLELFENAKTFGSLIQIPPKLAAKLPEIEKRLVDVLKYGDLTHASAQILKPLIQQARLLAQQYDSVVANPPYMGSKSFCGVLKDYLNDKFSIAPADLYTCFVLRNLSFGMPHSFVGMITLPAWMFLSSFEDFRQTILTTGTIVSFVHNGRGVWGSDFGSCSFVIGKAHLPHFEGAYRKLFTDQAAVSSNEELSARFVTTKTFLVSAAELQRLPGSPIAYWASSRVREAFERGVPLASVAEPRVGLQTGENDRFIRRWYEVNREHIGFGCKSLAEAAASRMKWFPYNKGGEFRKWYGNHEWVLNWQNDGAEVRSFGTEEGGRPRSRAQNTHSYFHKCLSWSKVTIGGFSVRFFEDGFVFDVAGCSLFPSDDRAFYLLAGILNSCLTPSILGTLAQTVNYEVGQVAKIPIISDWAEYAQDVSSVVRQCIHIAQDDWNGRETTWGFEKMTLVSCHGSDPHTVSASYDQWSAICGERVSQMQQLETKNNLLLSSAYRLQDELSPEVPDDKITLYRPNRTEDIKRLLSYIIGCMMGRYSLDKPGLIYAHSGNQSFDASQYKTFRADDDGIIPLLETDWGIRDDATNRIVEFISVAWPKENLEENLKFIAESLGTTSNEQPRDTIRRYLSASGSGGFYKHHLSMYKKRPIYWLFSSGKQRAFQCLVYLHRYHEGTLARMRTEYVIPLQGQIAGRIEQLEGDKLKATSTSHRKKLQKEQDDLKKQQAELLIFEEKLKHAADQKISLDLDDGVKVNYAKFGDLLAESKAITGGKGDD